MLKTKWLFDKLQKTEISSCILFVTLKWTAAWAPWQIVCCRNAALRAFRKICHCWSHLPIVFNPVNLKFELFHCLATFIELKSIGIDYFLKLKKMLGMSIFLDIPYVPKKITIGLSASITSKVLNESKYDFRVWKYNSLPAFCRKPH